MEVYKWAKRYKGAETGFFHVVPTNGIEFSVLICCSGTYYRPGFKGGGKMELG